MGTQYIWLDFASTDFRIDLWRLFHTAGLFFQLSANNWRDFFAQTLSLTTNPLSLAENALSLVEKLLVFYEENLKLVQESA